VQTTAFDARSSHRYKHSAELQGLTRDNEVILHYSASLPHRGKACKEGTSTWKLFLRNRRHGDAGKAKHATANSSTRSLALAGWNRLRGGGDTRLNPSRKGRAKAVVLAMAMVTPSGAAPQVSNVWIFPALVCATAYAFYNIFIKKASSSASAPIDPILGGVILQLVAATMGTLLYFWKKATSTGAATSPKTFTGGILQNGGVGWSVAAGLAVGAAEILSFVISGMGVPASKSIPTVVGGSVVVGTVCGSVWLKERLSLGGWIGVLMIAFGIALVGIDPGSAGGHP